MTNYIDPFAKLFCVRFDHSPKMARMYADIAAKDLSVTDIEDLRNDESNNGFRGSFFDSSSATAVIETNTFYNLGDTMKS